MERGTLFSQTALHALALQKRHTEVKGSLDPETGTMKGETADHLRAIESEMAATVDRLRVCYNAATSFEVSNFYAQRLYGAMRYFRMTEDPLFRQIGARLGKLTRDPTSQRQTRSTAIKSAAPPSPGNGANAVGGARVGHSGPANVAPHPFKLYDRPDEYAPEEFPPPNDNIFAQANSREGYLKVPPSRRGHWILRDSGIQITKDERRDEPW